MTELRPDNPDIHQSDSTALTWSLLIGRWLELARASVVLPPEDRWRRSVADVIALHAIACALADSLDLPTGERLLGVDRAAVLIRRHAASLNGIWRGVPMPERLAELIGDSRAAWQTASSAGAEWVVAWERFVMPAVDWSGRGADVLAPPGGMVLFRGSPAVFIRPDASGLGLPGLERQPGARPPRQVYRRLDEHCDIVAPLLTALPAGRPLLTWCVRDGVALPVSDGPADPCDHVMRVVPLVEGDSGPAT